MKRGQEEATLNILLFFISLLQDASPCCYKSVMLLMPGKNRPSLCLITSFHTWVSPVVHTTHTGL